MQHLHSHLSVLEQAATRYPDRPAFRIAQKSKTDDTVETWLPISFKEFQADVELAARYWFEKLSTHGVAPRSVVGLW